MSGMSAYSKFKELVVLGITASCDSHIHINPFGFTGQGRDKGSYVLFIDIAAKLLSTQDLVEFS